MMGREGAPIIVQGMSTENELQVWRVAMDLAVEVHRLSARLPKQERKGLADQMRRAASSVPANIAEGNARHHRREYLHFLSIAEGSLAELQTHLELARRLMYLSTRELAFALHYQRRVGRMLTKLVQSISI
jgi:four helix bundle protein